MTMANHRAARAWRNVGRQRGFTLVEMVAAFVIFALGFGILMEILTGALHTTRQSAEYTQAGLYAQSLLDAQGIGEPLKEGGSSGQFDDKYRWQLNIVKFQPQPIASTTAPGNPGPPILQSQGGIELFQLELIVTWGTEYLTHNARFATLRAMGPAKGGNQPAPVT
jgi:general secretion pathway protein I